MQPDNPFEAEHADRESADREQDHKRDRHEDSMAIDTAEDEVLDQCSDVLEDVGVQIHLGCLLQRIDERAISRGEDGERE